MKKISRRLLRPFRRPQLDAEMTEEIQRHLELRTQANVAAGMTSEEARADAQRRFGHLDSIKEEAREIHPGVWLELLGRDATTALRQLMKSPAFSLTVIGTLALAIAACTVVFTAIDSALLHPVDSPYADRIILIHETKLPQIPQSAVSAPLFLDLQRDAKSFQAITAWNRASFTLTGENEPLSLSAGAVSIDFFHALGAKMSIGRGFLPEDFVPGKSHVVVLNPAIWQSAFGGSPSVLGRVIHLDNEPYTVVGVLGDRFSRLGSDIDLWCPLVFGKEVGDPRARNFRSLQVTGVLKEGVSLAQAQAELTILAQRAEAQFPETNRGVGLLVRYFNQYLNRTLGPLLLLLLGAVGCVMAIACANVANLLLARASTRHREVTIRAALGASRSRLVRALLAESVLLSLLAGGAGIGLAYWGLSLLRTYGVSAGTDLARLAAVKLNPGVLLFTLGFSVLTGIVFGLAPAWLSSHVDLNEALKQGTRGSTEGRGRGRLRNTLVVLEVAFALMLLAGAGMLVRHFSQIARLDPGFSPDHIATQQVRLRPSKYRNDDARMAFADALVERLAALPDVESVALSGLLPTNGQGAAPFGIEGRSNPGNGLAYSGLIQVITPGYFPTMGVRVLRGQIFSAKLAPKAPLPAVINQTLAKSYFGEEDPLTHRLQLAIGPNQILSFEIVAVVADVMQGSAETPRSPQIYLPWAWANPGNYYALVRTHGSSAAVLSSLKPQIYAIDKDQAAGLPRLMTDLLDESFARQVLTLRLLTLFAGFALLIAAIGIYGVIAYSVSQRTSEIGIRMALGAQPTDVIGQFMRSGFRLVAIGLVLGLTLTLALGTVMQSVLFNANARDPVTLAAIVAILLTVALLACFLPARRAAKVDPLVALRTE